MTRYAPLWQQAGSYAASVDRYLIGALRPLGGCNAAAITTVNNTMNVSVAAGDCVVPLQSGQGAALCHWDAAEVVTLAAAPASGNTRVDLIICQVRDNALDGGGNNDFIITAVTGTPSTGFPAVPTAPTNAYALGTCTVGGAVANLNGSQIGYANRASLNSGTVLAVARLDTPTYSTTSTTAVLMDSTNAKLSYVVPGSGVVILKASVLWNNSIAGLKVGNQWSNVATNNTGTITDYAQSGTIDGTSYRTIPTIAQALTPGQAMTAYLQWWVAGGAGTVSMTGKSLLLEAIAI